MAITVKCPQCGVLVAAPDSAAGKKGRCTVCGAITEIPAIVQDAIPAPPRAPAEPLPDPKGSPEIVLENMPPAALPEFQASVPIATAEAESTEEVPEALPPLAPSSRSSTRALAIPAKKRLSCGMVALIVLMVVALLGMVAGIFGYFFIWPPIRDRYAAAQEMDGLAALHAIEAAQEAHHGRNGSYSARINTLESSGLKKDLVDAEAPPGAAKPLKGYFFSIVTQQGPNVGKRSYEAQGVLKEYAILAYPADSAFSFARKTYLRGPDGLIYSKELGARPGEIAAGMDGFDPDDTWNLESVGSPKEPGK